MLQHEYGWVRQTRGTLLDFCGKLDPHHFTHTNGFGCQSVRDTLVHIADCYVAWLGSFVLLKTKKPLTPRKEFHTLSLEEIIARFAQVDSLVNELLKLYEVDVLIEREIPWREAPELLTITPRKLLMHTITHEFHHKGQIVAMLRQMGYEPPNTDVLGTEN